ncbi:MAG: murein transglycosylase A [Proteobacteria bacterium]|nr:murein transglycosylase A [Pseudomonadota bacterium]MBU4037752.1 murein transglycosylase A [Pseudomonadota bacterium]
MQKKIKTLLGIFFLVSVLVSVFAGCAKIILKPGVKPSAIIKLSSSSYPDFTDDMNYENLDESIKQSLSYLFKRPASSKFKFGDDIYTTSQMIKSLEAFQKFIVSRPSADELRKYINTNYYVYKSAGSNRKEEVLFTGYYEPELDGSLFKSDIYKYPVYGIPADLVSMDLSLFSPKYQGEKITGRYTGQRVVPYYERREIEAGAIADNEAYIIAWVKDPVGLFFLQIQGSGKINLDNGETVNVHYHASNGHPYKSIGALLIQKDIIERSKMSMQSIREYLNSNPEKMQEILNHNPSYVFFKTEQDGPFGCLEVKLTPQRSIALDRRIFPLSGLVYIETLKPDVDENGEILGWSKCYKFVLAQDTGGAIRGPGRADLFWGNGKYAETAAGNMQHKGSFYFLMLKSNVETTQKSK